MDRPNLIHICKDEIFLLLTAAHEYRANNEIDTCNSSRNYQKLHPLEQRSPKCELDLSVVCCGVS
jgi:hypothetical protein